MTKAASGRASGQSVETGTDRQWLETEFGQRVEDKLQELYQRAETLLERNRAQVLAVAHALEAHKTVSGDDIRAVIEGVPGPQVDGGVYYTPEAVAELERYHDAAAEAHRNIGRIDVPLPRLNGRYSSLPVVAAVDASRADGEGRRRRLEHPLHLDDVEPAAELAADLALDADDARSRSASWSAIDASWPPTMRAITEWKPWSRRQADELLEQQPADALRRGGRGARRPSPRPSWRTPAGPCRGRASRTRPRSPSSSTATIAGWPPECSSIHATCSSSVRGTMSKVTVVSVTSKL